MPVEKDKTVIFENIRLASWPLLLYYACAGFKIYYLKMEPGLSKNKFFIKVQRYVLVSKFSEEGLDYAEDRECNCEAVRHVEAVYQVKFFCGPLTARLAIFMGSELVRSSYKKVLLDELYEFYSVKMCIEKFKKTCAEAPEFVPEKSSRIWEWLSAAKVVQGDFVRGLGVSVSLLGYFYVTLVRIVDGLKWRAGFLLFPAWVFLKVKSIVVHDIPRKNYQVGIRVYTTDLAFYHKYRTIDFLLDGAALNKDNALFCVETDIPDAYRNELIKRGYFIIELPKILGRISWRYFWRVLIKRFLFVWASAFKGLLFSSSLEIKVTLRNLYTDIIWERFLELFHIEHFVVYNDYQPQQLVRNILLARDGTTTWYYLHARDFGDTVVPVSKRKDYRWRKLAYFYYDNFLVYGKVEDFLKEHPQHVGNYLPLGCFWSEHVQTISKDKVLSDLKIDEKWKDCHSRSIVGVFNTDLGLGLQDMELLAESVLKILEKFPEIRVIFKEKYARDSVHPAMLPYFRKLDAHPRCCVPGDRFEATEIISVSDLIIGACFTSPVHEALGAGKKALYFDPQGRFVGMFYDQFPNLVAHGYSELEALVDYWLYKISDVEFADYLQQIKAGLDISSDVKPITKFRELLTRRS